MKKIEGLNNEIKSFDGTPIRGIGEGGKPEPLSYKTAILNHIGAYKAANGEEAVQALCIGQKIAQAGDSVTLEDAEIKVLSKSLDNMQYTALIMGQLYLAMNEAKVVQVEGAPEPQ